MDKQGREAKELVKNLSLKDKIKHFWYYYKWHTIACVLVAVLIGYTGVQCAMQVDYDFDIAFYNTRTIEQEHIDKFAELIATEAVDINDNNSVDVFVSFFAADITGEIIDSMAQAAYQRISMEMEADDYQAYLLDEPFMKRFENIYGDVIQSKMEISDIPEVRESLGLRDGEKLYLVTKKLFDRSKEDTTKIAEHENAERVEQFFINKTKKDIK